MIRTLYLAGGGEDRVEPPVGGNVEHLPGLVVGGEGDSLQQGLQSLPTLYTGNTGSADTQLSSVLDPDLFWIRIQWSPGSGSVLGIRIQEVKKNRDLKLNR